MGAPTRQPLGRLQHGRGRKRWWLDTPDLIAAAVAEQTARHEADPWEPAIADHLETVSETSVGVVLRAVIGLTTDKWTQTEQNRVARILRFNGWTRYQKRAGHKREWHYRKAPPSGQEDGPKGE